MITYYDWGLATVVDSFLFIGALLGLYLCYKAALEAKTATDGFICTILVLCFVSFFYVGIKLLEKDGNLKRMRTISAFAATYQESIGYKIFQVSGRTVYYTDLRGQLDSVNLKVAPDTKIVHVIEPESLAHPRKNLHIAGKDLSRPTLLDYRIN